MLRSRWIQGFILSILVVFVGCEIQKNPANPDTDSGIQGNLTKKGGYPAYAGEGVDGLFTLWAGKTTDAGDVRIATDVNNNTAVTITTNGNDDIEEVHIYLWFEENIPNHRPAPGHADYVLENINSNQLTIALVDHSIDIESFRGAYVSVHVALSGGETAYAGGNVYPDGFFPNGPGAWWGYIGHEYIPSDPNPR